MKDHYQWGWRQTLSWKVGFDRAQAGIPYKCPWWADEQVYGLAYLQGKDLKTPSARDIHGDRDQETR